jgi:hypothetical protein
MLAVAREQDRLAGLVRADLERPPFRAGAFDAVVCSRFMMHLPSETRVEVLRALGRVTRGPIVATVCHPYTVKSFGRAVRRLFGGRPKRSPRLTRRELEAEVAASGLRLAELRWVTRARRGSVDRGIAADARLASRSGHHHDAAPTSRRRSPSSP